MGTIVKHTIFIAGIYCANKIGRMLQLNERFYDARIASISSCFFFCVAVHLSILHSNNTRSTHSAASAARSGTCALPCVWLDTFIHTSGRETSANCGQCTCYAAQRRDVAARLYEDVRACVVNAVQCKRACRVSRASCSLPMHLHDGAHRSAMPFRVTMPQNPLRTCAGAAPRGNFSRRVALHVVLFARWLASFLLHTMQSSRHSRQIS